MEFTLHPWQLYFLILAGWVNRQQQTVIDYLRTENQVLCAGPATFALDACEWKRPLIS